MPSSWSCPCHVSHSSDRSRSPFQPHLAQCLPGHDEHSIFRIQKHWKAMIRIGIWMNLESLINHDLRPRGGAKASAPEWESGGQRGRKNTALFLEAGVKSPLYVALCPDPPAREEREERRKDERQRGERERERRERDERDEKEMREMREMRERERETVRQ